MKKPLIPADAILYGHRISRDPADETSVTFAAVYDVQYGCEAARGRFMQVRYSIDPTQAAAWSYRRGYRRRPGAAKWHRVRDAAGVEAVTTFAKECVTKHLRTLAQDRERVVTLSRRALPEAIVEYLADQAGI
ncbi:hypothetical protein ACLKMY_32910 [Paraburkholderia mimosarum]|uniref:hypothetical protein n=1 Tax=Paraburkholderia mimosarum TaxID=312026 RepID=UPI0039C09028